MERKPIYEFGPYRLDPQERLLLRNGGPVSLTPQAFDLLVALTENAGHLLSKDELRKKLWKDANVAEDNLKVTIGMLRKVLGDGPNGTEYIQTVQRQGYRFVTTVERVGDLPLTSPVPIAEKEQPIPPPLPGFGWKIRFRRPWLFAACCVFVLVVAAIAYGFIFPPSQPVILKYTQLTHQGHELGEFLPTDGVRVYFQEEVGVKHLIGVVPISGSREPVYIPVPFETPYLFGMFPGGESLLVGDDWPQSAYWKLPLPGGSLQPLGKIHGVSIVLSPDGRHYAQSEGGRALTVADVDGGPVRRLFSSDHSIVLQPSWSDDGKMICFTRLDPESDKGADVYSIWSIDADGSNLRELVSGKAGIGGPSLCSWTPGAKYLLFTAAISGKGDLWAIPDRALHLPFVRPQPVQLTNNPVEFFAPNAGPDGKTIFALGKLNRGELVRYDQKNGDWLPFMEGMPVDALDFSRDGQWVAYVRYHEGTLWRSRVDGTEPVQLTFSPYGADGPHWSPDGRRIAFRASLPGQPRRIFTISADGGVPQELLPPDDNKKEEGIPSWSADGSSIVFGELRYSPDKIAIHVMELATGKVVRLPGSEGLWTPRWSPDGRFILALTADSVSSLSGSLMLFDVCTRKWKTLTQDAIIDPAWSRDGKFIYYKGYPNPAVIRVRVSDGMVEKIVDLRDSKPEYDASFGLYVGLAPDDSPLMLRKVHQTEIYALQVKW